MTQRLAGAVTSCLAMLAGLWLILAPFALGTQPANTDWKNETFTDVWSGIGLGTLGLIGVIIFTTALLQHLAQRGLISPRTDRRQATTASTSDQPEPEHATASAAPSPSSDLDKLIAPLVESLTTDLARDRETASATTNNSARHPQSTPESHDA